MRAINTLATWLLLSRQLYNDIYERYRQLTKFHFHQIVNENTLTRMILFKLSSIIKRVFESAFSSSWISDEIGTMSNSFLSVALQIKSVIVVHGVTTNFLLETGKIRYELKLRYNCEAIYKF